MDLSDKETGAEIASDGHLYSFAPGESVYRIWNQLRRALCRYTA